jgi:hypothetical protein
VDSFPVSPALQLGQVIRVLRPVEIEGVDILDGVNPVVTPSEQREIEGIDIAGQKAGVVIGMEPAAELVQP